MTSHGAENDPVMRAWMQRQDTEALEDYQRRILDWRARVGATSHATENHPATRAWMQRLDPKALERYQEQMLAWRARVRGDSKLLLADEFYLAAHDPITVKPRLAEPQLLLGLAAALLGELIGAITIRNDQVIFTLPPEHNNDVAGMDDLSQHVYQQLARQRHVTSVHAWLEHLSTHSYNWVVRRLARQGLLTIIEQWQWRRLRKVRAHVPTDPVRAGAGISRVAGQLSRWKVLQSDDAVLVGLMDAAGLRECVLDATVPDQQGVDHQVGIRKRLDRLPTLELPPDFGELFTAFRSAADSLLLTGLA